METLNQLIASGQQLSHHAYALVVKGRDYSRKVLDFIEEKLGVKSQGNPDVFAQSYELLTIDDARGLKDLHSTRPFAENGRKFFVIEAAAMTHEAQNALLKMFEEPNEYAHFFLIMPSEESLLPTLRSRLFMVRDTRSHLELDTRSDLVRDFLALSPADRISLVDKLAAQISEERKPKSAALDFCADLARHLRQDGVEKNALALAALADVESYLRDRSPSIKQLLEYVALSV